MIEDLFFKSKIDNFNIIKDKCLKAIDELGSQSYREADHSISNTDWNIDSKIHRRYLDILRPAIEKHNLQVLNTFGNKFKIVVNNLWFQQYEFNDYHGLHTHPDCNFTNVIYIELDNTITSTSFLLNDKQFQIDVAEGDILTFPAFLPHMSPVNKGKRKTIVSYNSNVCNIK